MTMISPTIFRDSLNAHLERVGMSVAELSRRTGIPKTLLYKLAQEKVKSTNVEDAIKIATYFGMSIEEFVGMAENKPKNQRAAELLSRLNAQNIEVVEVLIRALVSKAD